MKIKINKLLTLCMVLFVLFASAIPTMAQEATTTAANPKGTITYHTGKHNVNGKQFKFYRLMDATTTTLTNPNQTTEVLVAYTINKDFEGFFNEKLVGSLVGDDTLDIKTQEYLKNNYSNKDFHDKLKIELANKAAVATIIGNTADSYTTDPLEYGYYAIVWDENVSLVNLYSANQDVYLKGIEPGVDKKIDENKDKDSAQIGDEVNFTVKSTVPNMTGFDQYTFKLVDTLSNGLTFVEGTILGGKLSVKVGDKTLTDNDIIVTKPDALNGNKLTIEIKDFIKYKDQANKEIIFKYSAILNENATIDGTGNTNAANVQYGNDPNALKGPKDPSTVTVYTHKLTINKKDNNKKPLAGAEFEIYKATQDGQKGEIVKFIKDPANNGTYRVATKAEINAVPKTENLVDKVVSPDNGTITINGLDAASYLIYETKAPDGYNKLKQPIKITIDANQGPDGNITVGGNEIEVINKPGTILPETGGMGTLMFTIIGVVGIIAVVYSFRPKKNK